MPTCTSLPYKKNENSEIKRKRNTPKKCQMVSRQKQRKVQQASRQWAEDGLEMLVLFTTFLPMTDSPVINPIRSEQVFGPLPLFLTPRGSLASPFLPTPSPTHPPFLFSVNRYNSKINHSPPQFAITYCPCVSVQKVVSLIK